jgi:hypothetical protein
MMLFRARQAIDAPMRAALSQYRKPFSLFPREVSMAQHRVPLSELATAVQAAVQKVLNEKGVHYPIWCGVFPPVELATEANAQKIATEIGKEAGVKVTPSVGQVSAVGGPQHGLTHPKIIGLRFDPPKA